VARCGPIDDPQRRASIDARRVLVVAERRPRFAAMTVEASGDAIAERISVIVCAFNEESALGPCLESLVQQSRPADEVIVVNNASTDRTRQVALTFGGIRVIDEPAKGLVRARAAGLAASTGSLLVYTDADCRAPRSWLAAIAREFERRPDAVAVTGPYHFYDWDWVGRLGARLYDVTLAPFAHVLSQRVFRIGAVFYGGNFAVRRTALERIGGFDTSIEFHGEDTNLGRRLAAVGFVRLASRCRTSTSARRYKAQGKLHVLRVYVRNFWSETVRHRPRDLTHDDVRG
jgi:glycosyltransferase involved in cell wall biosynthesis